MTLFPDEDLRPTAPEGPSVRVRMTVAYDGKGFHGFAPNPGIRTVGGSITDALAKVLGYRPFLTCAGRTDAGVHGWGQVVTFDAPAGDLDLARLQRSLNKLCGPQVAIRAVDIAPPTFDARRSARWRSYRYSVLNRPVPDPFLAARAWHVDEPLDLAAMRLGCDPLIGEHDFSSFCRVPRGVEVFTMVRRVFDAGWRDLGEGVLRFDITASSFCQQMVRAIVGLLVEVGRGRRTAADVASVLRALDRAANANIAPAHGLVLWEVGYDAASTM